MNFPRSRLPLWLSILLVGALLWAPLWGHLHGIEHGTERGVRQTLAAPDGQHEAHGHSGHVQGEHLHEGHPDTLGHEAHSDLCRVLDHLSQAERLSASTAQVLAPMGAIERPIFRAAVSPDQDLWSPAQARAPPALI